MILHITSIDNIASGSVHEPERVKHGIVMGRRVVDLFWWINPATHLNLDLPDHLLKEVFVASRLETGARVLATGDRLMNAPVDPGDYRHFGRPEATEMQRLSLRPAIPVSREWR